MKLGKIFILLAFFLSYHTTVIAQPCNFPSAWNNYLQSQAYTYTFDWSNLTLDMFPNESDLNVVKSNIRSSLSSAFGSWGNAAGISFNYIGDYQSSANISVQFGNLGGKAGDAIYNPLSVIFETSVDFSFSQGNYFIFITVALHEVGRLFHGTDHPNYDDTNSATIETYPQRYISSISSCDYYAMRQLYFYKATYNNQFETDLTGGDMKVNDIPTTLGQNGGSSTWHKNDVTKTLEALDQHAGSYFRLFNNWNEGEYLSRSINLSKIDKNYKSYFKKQFNITYNSSVTINYVNYSPYQTIYSKEGNQFNAYANPKVDLSMYYELDKWKLGSTVLGTDNPHSFNPSDHTNYTIEYKPIKPTNNYRNMRFNDASYGQPVVITWDKHPYDNSLIKHYAIWRKVRHNGVTGSPVQIGTVNANQSATYSFTDYDYLITNGYTDDLIYYDVRAYYESGNAYTDENFGPVFGEQNWLSINENNKHAIIQEIENELPPQYKINNYPNPFNPTTTINYQLPENGFVTIRVFDILGKEVVTLVNENKTAGNYKVNFDGSKLTSGVYIYTISANGVVQSKKMLLAK